MNYLAHLFLAGEAPDAILGALLGDFVKGPLDDRYGEAVRRAIALHRQIDVFTDAHALVRRSRARVSAPRQRFAGIMVDMFYDHFLALHWARYSPLELHEFSTRVYAVVLRYPAALPARLQQVAPLMARQDWLGSYREPRAVGEALDRISRRLKRENRLAGALEELQVDYAGFEADFAAFFPEVVKFARARRESP